MRQQSVLLQLLALPAVLASTAREGAADCPCLEPGDAAFAAAEAAVQAAIDLQTVSSAGIIIKSKEYGLDGCVAYDQPEAYCADTDDDVKTYPHWCVSSWCYVDNARCASSRGKAKSPILLEAGLDVYYSYNTCGSLDRYSVFADSLNTLMGRPLRISTGVSPPYVVAGPSITLDGWPHEGALAAFVDAVLRNFDPPPAFNVTNTFATADSMAKLGPFTTPYTACVHDVSVGNHDVCAVDTWMLPERMEMSDFLPPFSTEQFYLMVPYQPEDTQGNFTSSVKRIFRPFEGGTWAIMISFLVGSLAVYALVEDGEDGGEEGTGISSGGGEGEGEAQQQKSTRSARAVLDRAVVVLTLGIQCWFTGDVETLGQPTRGGRLVKIAFAFFIFISQSLFTANLAAILVTEASLNQIESMEEAIDAGLTICTGDATKGRLEQAYPNADFFIVPWEGLIARNLKTNGGECDAAVMPMGYWDKMRAGVYAEMDCADDTAACARDANGEPSLDRDCGYILVGGIVTQVSVSMPVRSELVHALGWSTLDLLSKGLYAELRDGKYAKDLPRSVCPLKAVALPSIAPSAFQGCVYVSGILLAIGLVMHLLWRGPSPTSSSSSSSSSSFASSSARKKIAGVDTVDTGGAAAGKASGEDADVVAMLDQIGKAHALLKAKFAPHTETFGEGFGDAEEAGNALSLRNVVHY